MFNVLKPLSKLTVSEWSDQFRFISPEAAAEPGKWHTDRAEYLRDIMDEMTSAQTRTVVCMKASQVGWTECVNNAVGYFIHQEPSPILVVHPTVEMGEAWSKDRLEPMRRDTPVLRDLIRDPKSRGSDNTILHKLFPGGHVTIVGANAPSGLAQRPIRVVVGDDIDRFPRSAGKEGDPISVAFKRQQTFTWQAKTLLGSTPTLKSTSRIYREWKRSDQRLYFVPCPHCSEPQVLKWSNVVWDKRLDDGSRVTGTVPKGRKSVEHFPDSAMFQCEHCHALFGDVERWDAVKHGEWRATAPFNGIAGFHITGFMSSFVTVKDIVQEFLDATTPELKQPWANTVLGEVWEDEGERVEAGDLPARAEMYDGKFLPVGVAAITAGVDVQGNRLEVQFVGWGEGEEAWPFKYLTIFGDPAQRDVWTDLDGLLREQWETEDGRKLRTRAVCIDTGGHHAAAVYAFCRKRLERRVFPIKGRAGAYPIWPGRGSRTGAQNDTVYMVGVDSAKDTIYSRLRIEAKRGDDGELLPTQGYIHFATTDQGFDGAYFDQLTAEEVQTRYKEGKPYRVWVLQTGRRNEALDTFVYALAALRALPGAIRNRVEETYKVPVPRPTEEGQPEQLVNLPRNLSTETTAKTRFKPPAVFRRRSRDPFL